LIEHDKLQDANVTRETVYMYLLSQGVIVNLMNQVVSRNIWGVTPVKRLNARAKAA
jgi:hypothetical protein